MKKSVLVELIRSLSKHEKRFFSLYSGRYFSQDTKEYLQLFRFYEKASDEEIYAYEHPKKPLSATERNRRAVVKHYLYSMLIDTLLINSDQLDYTNQLTKKLAEAKLLFAKNLFKAALKKIVAVRVDAEQTESFEVMIQAMSLQEQIMLNADCKMSEIHDLEITKRDLLQRMLLNSKLETIRYKMLDLFESTGFPDTDEDRCAFHDMMQEAESIAQDDPGIRGKLTLLRIRSRYCELMKDFDGGFKVMQEMYSWFKQHEFLRVAYVREYVATGSSLVTAHIRAQQTEGVEDVIKDMRAALDLKAVKENSELNAYLLFRVLSTELYFLGHRKDLQGIIAREQDCSVLMNGIDDEYSFSQRMSICYNISFAHFLLGNYKQCRKTLFKMLSHPFAKRRFDYYVLSRVLFTIVSIELKDLDFAESELASLNRYLANRRKEVRKMDKKIVQILQRVAHSGWTKETLQLASAFYHAHSQEIRSGFTEYECVLRWLEMQPLQAKDSNIVIESEMELMS